MATFTILFYISALALACVANQSGVNPGIKARVTQRGLDFATEIALGFVDKAVDDLSLPSFSGDSPVKYNVQNLNIDSFSVGNTRFTTAAPNVITPTIDNGAVAASADFSASKTFKVFGFSFTLSESGRLIASASDLDLSQRIGLGMDANGKPTFSVGDCDSDIGNLDVRVEGTKLDSVFNFIIGLFKETLKNELQKRICPAVKGALLKQASTVTQKFKLTFPFVSGTKVDLGLVCNPEATGNEFIVSLKGKCFPSSMPNLAFPFVAPSMPAISGTSKMACISVGPYVLNTLLYSMWNLGQLEKTFNVDKIGSLGDLSALLPPLAVIGNNPVQIVVRATGAPSVQLTTAGIGIDVSFEAVINAVLPDGTLQHAITASADVAVLAEARIDNGKIAGTIQTLDVTVTDAGIFPAELFNQLIQAFLPQAILPAVNGITEAGFEIPSLYDFRFSSASVAHKQNALEVCSDFASN
ncbi:bactericidal permeability-increasing protein-like [Clavelina lepadiformis]|uniref:bactericidal permeability-increasing protein-like n=1 Tax=Clavelina lepadiformis TaxID=159417 RepID=UPI004042510B